MNKKDICIIILKVVIYACTLALGVLGVSAITSCSASRDVTVDTTRINHNTYIKFPKR